jgi:hypothetical protein
MSLVCLSNRLRSIIHGFPLLAPLFTRATYLLTSYTKYSACHSESLASMYLARECIPDNHGHWFAAIQARGTHFRPSLTAPDQQRTVPAPLVHNRDLA